MARSRAYGFEVGKQGRRLRAIPSTGVAINTLIRHYGRTVVARSRYLVANNPYASAAKDSYVSNLAGNGIKPSSLIGNASAKKEIQQLFLDWTDEADADGLTDFYGLQNIIAAEMFEAGECFVRLRPRFASDGLTVPLQLQILPSEMLPTDHNEVLPNGGRIECGIEFDPIGKRVAYYFYRQHPGEAFGSTRNSLEKTKVPAEEILHMFKPIRAGQIRGVPHTIAGMTTLAMLDLYDDAELERKRIAALFAAFVKRTRGEEDEEHPLAGAEATQDAADSTSDWSLEPGAVIDLLEGQEVQFSEPADVGGAYEPFQYRNLLRAATGFGVTYTDMTGDLRQTSYSSDRSGLVRLRRKIEAQQNHIMIFQFCRPVWLRWFQEAVLSGALKTVKAGEYESDPRNVTRVKWFPPRWEWVDPLKDQQAEKLAVDAGFKARSDVIESLGYDPEEIDARIADDQERAATLGLKIVQMPGLISLTSEDDTSTDPGATDTNGPGGQDTPGGANDPAAPGDSGDGEDATVQATLSGKDGLKFVSGLTKRDRRKANMTGLAIRAALS